MSRVKKRFKMKELKRFWKVAGLLLVILSGVSALSFAEEKESKETKKIQDNSFLIEEAYNQEPGIIQHMTPWRASAHWLASAA